jgi:hypothetical protein
MGKYAGNQNVDGDHNIYLGRDAGINATGGANVFIGGYAGNNQTGGSNNVIIGYDIDVNDTNASTQLKIGSANDYWLRGDSARSVYIKNNLVFESNNTQIVMKDSTGASWSVGISTTGVLTTAPFV